MSIALDSRADDKGTMDEKICPGLTSSNYFHNKLNFNFPACNIFSCLFRIFHSKDWIVAYDKKKIYQQQSSLVKQAKGERCTLKSIFQHEGFLHRCQTQNSPGSPIIKTNKISNFFFFCCFSRCICRPLDSQPRKNSVKQFPQVDDRRIA